MAARIRRQKRIDRAEAEEEDRQVAMQLIVSQQNMPAIIRADASMFVRIKIEVMSEININDLDTPLPSSWTIATVPTRVPDAVIFDVPGEELRQIPYPVGTRMRFVPRTNTLLQPLRPSRWFTSGVDQHIDSNFSAHCNETGFHHIHYSMSNSAYDEMALDMFMAYEILIAVSD